MSEIQDQVKKIVIDHLGIDESKVVPGGKARLWKRSKKTKEVMMVPSDKLQMSLEQTSSVANAGADNHVAGGARKPQTSVASVELGPAAAHLSRLSGS